MEQYEPLYERLRIKECFLIKSYAERFGGTSAGVDETEQIVDSIQAYREAMWSYLDLATGEHRDLLNELTGGINSKVYQTYAKMLQLNEVCERFLKIDDNDQTATESQLNSILNNSSSTGGLMTNILGS